MKQTILSEKLFTDFADYFEPFLQQVGLNKIVLKDPSFEFPERKFIELLELAAGKDNNDLGLKIGNQVLPEHIGALGHAIVNAKNLNQAIETAVNYIVTYSHFSHIQFAQKEDKVEISYQISAPTILKKRQDAEFAIATIYQILNQCAGQEIQLTAVEFEHDKPSNISTHKSIFQCPVRFNAAKSKLTFPIAALQLSSGKNDSRLFNILISHLDNEKKIRDVSQLKDQLSFLIASQLHTGDVSINNISKLLGCSVRTLQRRLDDKGIDYSFFLNDIRQKLAISYIKDTRFTLIDISNKLGYKESSSFTRAFKRWTGMTPKKYRQTV